MVCLKFSALYISASAGSQFAPGLPRKRSVSHLLGQGDELLNLADRGVGVSRLQRQAASLSCSVDRCGDGVLERPQFLHACNNSPSVSERDLAYKPELLTSRHP
eukprot:COSAG05_NODE_1175_length_5616_cov_2.565343_6_plen_104_part_00